MVVESIGGDYLARSLEALRHGGYRNEVKVNIEAIESDRLRPELVDEQLGHLDGILVPGGFGARGIEGKIHAVRYAREVHEGQSRKGSNVPYIAHLLGVITGDDHQRPVAAGLLGTEWTLAPSARSRARKRWRSAGSI